MKYLTFILLFLVPDSEIHCARIVKDIQVNNPQRKSAQACEQFGIPPRRLSSRIINGIRAEIDEFPHYALLWKKNKIDGSIKFRCGGTLISESFVLTAAHCKWKMCYENITECIVRLGTNILDEKSQDYSGIDKKILVSQSQILSKMSILFFLEIYGLRQLHNLQKSQRHRFDRASRKSFFKL